MGRNEVGDGRPLRFAFLWGGFGAFLVLELRAPYRPRTVSKPGRWTTNLFLTAANGLLMSLAFATAFLATTAYVTKHRMGVLALLDPPGWVRLVVVVTFVDFMLYVRHLLNHKIPLLWHFHRGHHSDLNMEVSTATRFHIGDLAVSVAVCGQCHAPPAPDHYRGDEWPPVVDRMARNMKNMGYGELPETDHKSIEDYLRENAQH